MSYIKNSNDSIFVKYIDTSGNDVWATPKLIANASISSYVLAIDNAGFNVFPTASGAIITHNITYYGGAGGFSYNRIDFSGNLTFPILSKKWSQYLLAGYNFLCQKDMNDGLYLLAKGNGIGSLLTIYHISNVTDTMSWSTGTEVTGGAPNAFGGNISLMVDASNNLYVVWDAMYYTKIFISKLTTSGSFAWPQSRINLSDSSLYSPTLSTGRIKNNNIFVSWLETHNSNTILKVQRLDTAGATLWNTYGNIVDSTNGLYSRPRIAFNDSGITVALIPYNAGFTFALQAIRNNGTNIWNDNGRVLDATPGMPSYEYFTLLDSRLGCNVAYWVKQIGPASDIYGGKACLTLAPLALNYTDFDVVCSGTHVSVLWKVQSDESGKFWVERSVDSKNWETIHQVTLKENQAGYNYVYYDEPTNGGYYRIVFESINGNKTFSEIKKALCQSIAAYQVYPNPSTTAINFKSSNSSSTEMLKIINPNGTLVHQSSFIGSATVDVNRFNPGIYFYEITNKQTQATNRGTFTVLQ